MFVNGPGGRRIWLGATVTACCATTYALTLISGILVDEVFRVTGAMADGEWNGAIAVMSRSNSLPSLTVFSSALNELLVHCKSDRIKGWSRWLMIRTILVSLVWDSLETVNTAIV